MKVAIVRTSFIIVSLLALSGALSGIGSHEGFGTVAALAVSSKSAPLAGRGVRNHG